MRLEKGTVFELSYDKFFVIDVGKHAITNIEYVMYKKFDSDVVMCLESKYFSNVKIWGGIDE